MPNKRYRALFAAMALVANAAWAQTEYGAQSPKLTATDQQFMQDAGTAGATEIAASKLALANSSDKQIKDFAQRMIADHTKLARNYCKNRPRYRR